MYLLTPSWTLRLIMVQNMGVTMPGWYDITSLNDVNRSEDDEGIAKSRNYFHGLIADEVKGGIAADRVVIGGFSQGGAMSLHAGLTAPSKLAGIFGLSCYMLLRDKTRALITESR
jgi:predicted esterase